MTSKPKPPRSGCPISLALDLLGDAWSLLIVRDLMFKGMSRFGEFLDAGEGIATNVLSARLKHLEAVGIIERQPDTRDARSQRYRLTEKGIDLAPTLVELILWSARHQHTDAPPEVLALMRQDPAAFAAQARAQWAAQGAPEGGA